MTLIQRGAQIMDPYDEDMVQIMQKELLDYGVNLELRAAVEKLKQRMCYLQTVKDCSRGSYSCSRCET